MKAIVFRKYGPAEVLKVEEVEKPIPQDNELLIRVHAASVNTSDAIGRLGKPIIARIGNGLIAPKKTILGVAVAGQVEQVGSAVKKFKVGDRVIATTSINGGGYAEYISLAETAPIILMPRNVTFEEAAAIPYGVLTALPFLRDNGRIKQGDKVLIIGASGAIGTFAVQLARHFGAEVTGVCSTANLELIKAIGANHVIDYTVTDITTSKENYDIIFDTVGKSSFKICKNLLNQDGAYLLTIPTLAIMFQMLWTNVRGGKKAKFAATSMRSNSQKNNDLAFVKNLVELGRIKSILDHTYPMEAIVAAHKYVETGKKRGNIVLKIA